MPKCYYLDLVCKIQAICLDFHAYQTISAEATTAESVISAPPQYADCAASTTPTEPKDSKDCAHNDVYPAIHRIFQGQGQESHHHWNQH